jgi:hypothetical protein
MKIKFFLTILISSGFLFCSAQETIEVISHKIKAAHIENDNNKIGQAYQAAGQFYYDRNADQSILYQDSAAIYFSKAGNQSFVALSYQNIAFAYEEKKNEPSKAIPYVNRAIDTWITLKDTVNLANILKYLGLLQSKTNDFVNAKSNMDKALELFRAKRFIPGQAVCYFDMAMLYKARGYEDSTIFMLYKARDIWYQLKGYSRIQVINNQFIDLYTKNKSYSNVPAFIDDNIKLTKKKEINWQNRLNFYHLTANYYAQVNQTDEAGEYTKKYEKLKSKLSEKGIAVE